MNDQLNSLLNAFSGNNQFIMVDQNQSVGSLIQQIDTRQEANIIIRQDDSFNIYQDSNALGDLARAYDPKKKIKTFININTDRLNAPIVINLNEQAEAKSSITDILGRLSGGEGSLNSMIGNSGGLGSLAGLFEKIQTDAPSAAGGDNDSDSGTTRSVDFNALPQAVTTPAKPYYIVSEFEDTVKADTVFNIDVFLSREAGKKSSNPLKLEEGWQIDVLVIPKSGLDLEGEYFQSIIVKNENLEKRLHFSMKARTEGTGSFVITARYQGTELFHTEYQVSILPATANVKTNIASTQSLIKGKPQSTAPDLTLLITQTHDDGQLTLKYFLHSPDNSLNLTYKNFKATIQQKDVGTYFLDFFNDIDSIKQDTKQQRLNAVEIMKAKGAKLYRDLFPEDFRRIFWNIHDKIKSIVINSDEPWIPWEMCFMYPEETGIADGIFLCEDFEISRWISGSYSPVTEISLANAAIVIPGDSKLIFPPSEKESIQATLGSINAQLTEVTASFQDVRQSFLTGNYNVWHFSGHGTDSSGINSSRYKILLENGDALSPDDITGMKSIGKGKPIVFFNACQASKPGLGLTGLSGWPKQFIDNNVSAFIGAYWSVIDETACKLSGKFYELLAAGETIAAALKKARLHVKDDGNPTWLAYTLYADPFAKISLS